METFKAVFLDYLRKELGRRGPEVEAAFMARLTHDEQQAYRALLPVSWVTPAEASSSALSCAWVVVAG